MVLKIVESDMQEIKDVSTALVSMGYTVILDDSNLKIEKGDINVQVDIAYNHRVGTYVYR
ncbi:MAG: hypothetical protein HQK91_14420 [Nitrospirae bacterium]|nr:hypothetical protein [Nitrospirota bacterium]MBF0542633.1 hypothetical protein [Nitrospirota bacterium]